MEHRSPSSRCPSSLISLVQRWVCGVCSSLDTGIGYFNRFIIVLLYLGPSNLASEPGIYGWIPPRFLSEGYGHLPPLECTNMANILWSKCGVGCLLDNSQWMIQYSVFQAIFVCLFTMPDSIINMPGVDLPQPQNR